VCQNVQPSISCHLFNFFLFPYMSFYRSEYFRSPESKHLIDFLIFPSICFYRVGYSWPKSLGRCLSLVQHAACQNVQPPISNPLIDFLLFPSISFYRSKYFRPTGLNIPGLQNPVISLISFYFLPFPCTGLNISGLQHVVADVIVIAMVWSHLCRGRERVL
jgi:hypothetical protein